MRFVVPASLRAAKYGLVGIAMAGGSAFGQSAAEPGERSFSVFLVPMMTLASLDTSVVVANTAVAARAVMLQRPLAREQAEARYQEGLGLARKSETRAALIAFHDAAGSGHGFAQRKLGDIYGTGNDAAERDYETSLRWYQNARNQGIDIPNKPFVYPGVRR